MALAVAVLVVPTYTNAQAQGDTSDYTVLVYMVGSDLESNYQAATTDIFEMLEGKIGSNINVILLTGGANTEDFSTVKLRQVTDNEVLELEELGSYSMGDPALLQDFLIYGIQAFPADNYAVIFWNHGGGIEGFGWDEVHDNDHLEVNELIGALAVTKSETGVNFELIGFDACLMATTEVAYNLKDFGNYLVSSEEIEPGHGWDWAAITTALSQNPSMTGADLGITIAESYKNHAEVNSDGNQHKQITLSVVDLNQIDQVVAGLDALSTSLSDFDSEGRQLLAISSARAYAEEYGKDESGGNSKDLVDLIDFLILLASEKPELESEIQNLISSVDNAVVYSINGETKPYASGLSIYLPFNGQYFEDYESIEFSNSWQDFIRNYMQARAQDTVAPEFDNESFSESELQAEVISTDVVQNYVSLSRFDAESGREQILGEYPVGVDETGNVDFVWDSAWFVLCNEQDCSEASFFIDWISDVELSITVPAIVNDEDADLLYILDAESGEIEFIGYWPGIEDTGAQKEIFNLYSGDIVNTLMLEYDPAIDDFVYTTDDLDIVVDDEFGLYYLTLPAGEYYATFLALDAAGNWGISDSIVVQSTGSETYATAEYDINEEPVGIQEQIPEQTESEKPITEPEENSVTPENETESSPAEEETVPTPIEDQENTVPVTTGNEETPASSGSANTQTGGGGCLIATAAFGSELTPQVQFLRGFRDNHILSTAAGSSFMTVFNSWYYSFSPYVADYERQQPWLQQTVKATIYPLLGILHISEKAYSSISGEYGALSAGLVASAMIGALYFSPIALSIKQVRKSNFNYKLAIVVLAATFIAVVGSTLTGNQITMMVTTSLFVLSIVTVTAIVSARALTRILKRANDIFRRQ